MAKDIRGEEIKLDDIVAVARHVYRTSQLLVGKVTRITDTRIYYDCHDSNCDTDHWVVYYDKSFNRHKRVELLVLAKNTTPQEFMEHFSPLRN